MTGDHSCSSRKHQGSPLTDNISLFRGQLQSTLCCEHASHISHLSRVLRDTTLTETAPRAPHHGSRKHCELHWSASVCTPVLVEVGARARQRSLCYAGQGWALRSLPPSYARLSQRAGGRLMCGLVFCSGTQKLQSFNVTTGGPVMSLMAPKMDTFLGSHQRRRED